MVIRIWAKMKGQSFLYSIQQEQLLFLDPLFFTPLSPFLSPFFCLWPLHRFVYFTFPPISFISTFTSFPLVQPMIVFQTLWSCYRAILPLLCPLSARYHFVSWTWCRGGFFLFLIKAWAMIPVVLFLNASQKKWPLTITGERRKRDHACPPACMRAYCIHCNIHAYIRVHVAAYGCA